MQTDTAVHWNLSLFSSAGEGSLIDLVFHIEYLPASITVFIQWGACNSCQWNSSESFHFISITGFAGPKDYSAFYSDITNCQPIGTVILIALSFHLLTSEKYDGAVEGKFELWNPLCIENVLWIHVFDEYYLTGENSVLSCPLSLPLLFVPSSHVYQLTNFIRTQESASCLPVH